MYTFNWAASLSLISGMSSAAAGKAAAGAIAGFAAGAVGTGTLKGAFSGALGGAVLGFAGGVSSTLQGGRFGHGFVSAGVTEAAKPGLTRLGEGPRCAVAEAIVGGTASAATGGKFANGAVTAAMAYAVGRIAESEEDVRQRKMDRETRRALNKYNPLSVAEDQECAGLTYETKEGRVRSTPGVPGGECGGGPCSSNPWDAMKHVPEGAIVLADWHTHGAYNPKQPDISYEYSSSGDVRGINSDGSQRPGYRGGYLGTPKGRAYYYPAGSLNYADYSVEAIKRIQRPVGRIRN
jgi:hypothetical protein